MLVLLEKIKSFFQNKSYPEQCTAGHFLDSDAYISQLNSKDACIFEWMFKSEANQLNKFNDTNFSASIYPDNNFLLKQSKSFNKYSIPFEFTFDKFSESYLLTSTLMREEETLTQSYSKIYTDKINMIASEVESRFFEISEAHKPSVVQPDFRELSKWERIQALVNEEATVLDSLNTEILGSDIEDDFQKYLIQRLSFVRHRHKKLTKVINRVIREFLSLFKVSRDLRTEIRTRVNVIFKNMDDESHILIG
tara:strand:+ start:211 stop:963 length:753 start_codon:yes stop_codon:yes gene_type:complete